MDKISLLLTTGNNIVDKKIANKELNPAVTYDITTLAISL